MSQKKKIGFFARFLSMRRYLNEVPVEGKKTKPFLRSLGYYDQYVSQVIRTGNCTTLLSTNFEITEASFWNINHFEDYARYVFWTFNKSFLQKLTESIQDQKLSTLKRCYELLNENRNAYAGVTQDETDEELSMCHIKNTNLRKDPAFYRMYDLDEQNRNMILSAIVQRITEINASSSPAHPMHAYKAFTSLITSGQAPAPIPGPDQSIRPQQISFLQMLKPLNGNSETTLQFIKDKIQEAGITFSLFSPVTRIATGKNPYGFNDCMGAVIDFFFQGDYFKKEYSFNDIFRAYLEYSGNSIGKLNTFLSEFRQDKGYKKNFSKLKALKINKLP